MSTIDNSWIKLPRSFAKWRWYHDSNMVHLYLYLLLNANLEDEEYNQTVIHRGELITSLSELAFCTSLSVRTIRTCLNKLSKTKEIKCKSTHKGHLIILVEFNKFQPIGMDEYCIDWIKLYRQICTWRWYNEPKFLHLFLHFMVQARIVTLGNGADVWQCMTSLSQLSKETGISVRSIRTCIKRLQATGEIMYGTNSTNRKSTITICNYDTYQTSKFKSDKQVTNNRQTSDKQLTNVRVNFQKDKKSTQCEMDINSCMQTTYQASKFKSDKQVTNNRQTSDKQLTNNRQTSDKQVTTLKEYKNIRKEEEKNISNDDVTRACERDFVEVLEVSSEEKENEQKKVQKESFSGKVLGEQVWLAAIQKKFKLPSIEAVKEKVGEFELDLICRGKEEHKDEKDYKSHFCDWLAKTSFPRSAPSQASSGYQAPGKERWPGEKFVPKSSEGGIYEGEF